MKNFGIMIPDKMREEVGYLMKGVSDHAHAELTPEQMYEIFQKEYNNPEKKFDVVECHFVQEDGITAKVSIKEGDTVTVVEAKGNGRLNAVNNTFKKHFNIEYSLDEYEEHALSKKSNAKAMAYVGVNKGDGKIYWGISSDEDIIRASIDALVNAVNKIL